MLAQKKTQIRHNLPPLLSRILCISLLFVDDLFQSVFRSDFVFPSRVALRWVLAFLLMLFIVLFRVPLAVFCIFWRLSNFLARFSGLASIAPLPSPSPFHYVMAKRVPVVQLAAHAKSSTLYGRTILRSYNQNFSAWWVTTFSYNYGATQELRYKNSAYYLMIHTVLKE